MAVEGRNGSAAAGPWTGAPGRDRDGSSRRRRRRKERGPPPRSDWILAIAAQIEKADYLWAFWDSQKKKLWAFWCWVFTRLGPSVRSSFTAGAGAGAAVEACRAPFESVVRLSELSGLGW